MCLAHSLFEQVATKLLGNYSRDSLAPCSNWLRPRCLDLTPERLDRTPFTRSCGRVVRPFNPRALIANPFEGGSTMPLCLVFGPFYISIFPLHDTGVLSSLLVFLFPNLLALLVELNMFVVQLLSTQNHRFLCCFVIIHINASFLGFSCLNSNILFGHLTSRP